MATFTPRDYQVDTVQRIESALQQHRSTLAILATGLGKTVIACDLMRRAAERGQRSLFLAHRRELIDQTAATVSRLTGIAAEVEMAERRGITAGEHRGLFARAPIAVASKDTLIRRLHKVSPSSFDLIVIDECHHAESNSYKTICERFPAAKVVGITATPMRGDGKDLTVFDSVAQKIDIIDGIGRGWLVPIRYTSHVVRALSLRDVAIDKKSRDYQVGDLARALLDEATTRESAAILADEVRGCKALVFTPSVAVAYAMCDALRSLGIRAEAADGNTDDARRADLVDRFRRGEIEALCNCALWTEGFDAPVCDTVAMLRPTKSKGLYLQMIGRGTRPLPGTVDGVEVERERHAAIHASDKPAVRVIDLMANDHDEALRAVSIYECLAGRDLTPEEREELQRSDGEPTEFEKRAHDEIDDMAAAEKKAALSSVDPIEKYRELLERQRVKAEARAAKQAAAEQRKAKREAAEASPPIKWSKEIMRWRNQLARDMAHLGLRIDTSQAVEVIGHTAIGSSIEADAGGSKHVALLTMAEAAALRRMAAARRESGCCTAKMAMVLGRNGVSEPHRVTFDSAKRAMGILAGKWNDPGARAAAARVVRYVGDGVAATVAQ